MSAHISLIDQGTAISEQALIDCQKGDYPGGGMGLLSIATMKPSAHAEHCRR